MRLRSLFAAALVVAFASSVATPVAAAERTAEQRSAAREFAAGERAFNAGDFRRAAESFEAAFRASPHHAPLWNAAKSWLRAGQDVRAANVLERFLHAAPADSPDRDHATAALAEVSRRIGRIELHRALARAVEVDDGPTAAAVLYVAPGEHVIHATASDGEEIVRRVNVVAGAVASVSLAPAPPVERTATRAVAEPPARSERSASQDDGVERRRSPKPLSPWFVAGGGAATIAAGGLAAVFGLQTVHSRDAFQADPTPEGYSDAMSSQTRTNVALATTGVFAVATGAMALFFVDWGGR